MGPLKIFQNFFEKFFEKFFSKKKNLKKFFFRALKRFSQRASTTSLGPEKIFFQKFFFEKNFSKKSRGICGGPNWVNFVFSVWPMPRFPPGGPASFGAPFIGPNPDPLGYSHFWAFSYLRKIFPPRGKFEGIRGAEVISNLVGKGPNSHSFFYWGEYARVPLSVPTPQENRRARFFSSVRVADSLGIKTL